MDKMKRHPPNTMSAMLRGRSAGVLIPPETEFALPEMMEEEEEEEEEEGEESNGGMMGSQRPGTMTRRGPMPPSMSAMLRQRGQPSAAQDGNSGAASSKIRYAHQAPDGTIHYFERDGGWMNEGTLPPGSDQAEIETEGFQFVDGETYARMQRQMDPIASSEDAEDELARAFDATLGAQPAPRRARSGLARLLTTLNDPQE